MTSQSLFDEAFLRQLEQLALLSRQVRRGQMQGVRRSSKRGQAVEFADYRDYVPGDDLRAVDWNVYARLERLFVKLFVEEEDAAVHLLLDGSESMTYGSPAKWPYAIRLAGALGYVALAGMDRLTATMLNEAASAAGRTRSGLSGLRGKQHAIAWFDWLQAQRPGGAGRLGPALARHAAALGGSDRSRVALVFSDLLDPTWQDGLAGLAGHGFEVVLLHLLAPDEVRPDLEGDIRLVDSESGDGVEMTADYDLLLRYRANLAAWQEDVQAFCARRGITYVFIETSLPVEASLLTVLRQHRVLK